MREYSNGGEHGASRTETSGIKSYKAEQASAAGPAVGPAVGQAVS